MVDKYILDDDHHVVPAPGLKAWAVFMDQHKKRVVEQTTTRHYWVSTVFLGIDHGWYGKRLPVVFETMTFDRRHVVKEWSFDPGRLRRVREEADLPGWSFDRYSSWDDALTGHRAIVGRILRLEAKAKATTS